MLERLGKMLVRRRRAVVIAAAVGFVAAGAIGGGVAQHLSSGGFQDDSAESVRADDVREDLFGTADPNFLLVVTARAGTVDDPAVAAVGLDITERLAAEPETTDVISYWTLGNAPPLRSDDGTRALVIARVDGDEDEVDAAVERLTPIYGRDGDVVEVGVGGFGQVFAEVGKQIEGDLTKAEALALPITLLLLVLIFGGIIAASLPLMVGILAIIGTFLVLRVIAELTQVSIFSLNMTTALGLGLAIDYSLFIVSRFREELHRGATSDDAVVRAVQTAGRTVIYSALTVAVSMSALLVFPLAFLRSFAYAGIPVVLIAGVSAVVVLPAVLAMLGSRIDRWAIRAAQPKEVGEGFWHRLAVAVMRRPVLIGVSAVAVLLFLGSPFLHIRLGLPDDRVLPKSAPSRQVHDVIREEFPTDEAGALSVVVRDAPAPDQRAAAVDGYATSLSSVRGVGRVDAETGIYIRGVKVAPSPVVDRFARPTATWLSVVPTVEPISGEGEHLVKDVRSTEAPFEVLVGGTSARLVDAKASLFSRMPLALVIIALTTFLVLFLMVGSVLVPIKALVLNMLSLTATFGAMVWIFQDGHLAGLLNFTPVGYIDVATPILMFCIAFGLSMDYEVFLLSRIKEEYDTTLDNERAVAVGLERTGRIVTAAAALIAVVFIAQLTSKVTFIKLFGLGMALGVIMDATILRATLVPAFMRLAGRGNWWAPGPLARFYDRFGLTEREVAPVGAPDAVLDLRDQPRAGVPGNARNRDQAKGPGRKPPHERVRERPLRAAGR